MTDTMRFCIHKPMVRNLLPPSPKINIDAFSNALINFNMITPSPTCLSSLAIPLKPQVT